MSSRDSDPVYAYFYPLTTKCEERERRADAHGTSLVDETQLCQDALPLYENHRQPVTYCLGDQALNNGMIRILLRCRDRLTWQARTG